MNSLYILIGAGLLILGRKYIWIFTAGVVYFITLEATGKLLADLPYILIIFVALVMGASGALLASVFRPIAISLAVLLSSSYLFSHPAAAYKWFPGQVWLSYLLGGVLGLVLVAGVSNWTLVVLSSLFGALMVTRGLSISPGWNLVAFLGITLAGIVIQMMIVLIEQPAIVPVEEEKTGEEAETGIVENLTKS
jgi:hypothetical protein